MTAPGSAVVPLRYDFIKGYLLTYTVGAIDKNYGDTRNEVRNV